MMLMGDGPPKERGRHRTKVENDIISRRERDFRHQQMWTGAVDYYKHWGKINTKFEEWTSPRYYEDNNKMLCGKFSGSGSLFYALSDILEKFAKIYSYRVGVRGEIPHAKIFIFYICIGPILLCFVRTGG